MHAQGLLTGQSPGMLESGRTRVLQRPRACRSVRLRVRATNGGSTSRPSSAHHRQLEVWARDCPENFENRLLLVGRGDRAHRGTRSRRRCGSTSRPFSRRAKTGSSTTRLSPSSSPARFYAGRGFERIARAYLRDARDGYRQWGADGKVRQLEERYPYLTDGASRRRSDADGADAG